jgi:hypothetical protein
MKNSELFPKISAQAFNSPNKKEEYFLFNPITNKGFAIDGFAAILCKKFTGDRTFSQIIEEFEKEQDLEKNEFEAEIISLVSDLEKNNLVTFYESAQEAKA